MLNSHSERNMSKQDELEMELEIAKARLSHFAQMVGELYRWGVYEDDEEVVENVIKVAKEAIIHFSEKEEQLKDELEKLTTMTTEDKIEIIKNYREITKWYGPDNLVWCLYYDADTGEYTECEEDIDELYDTVLAEKRALFDD